ncbi:MAG: hypothetical protein F6K62_11490 [Sphaerospermopsis sp. SIO1G2]|nr:hypothetical protein [Sphaerospermopsis sp. SIO1G2]
MKAGMNGAIVSAAKILPLSNICSREMSQFWAIAYSKSLIPVVVVEKM